MNRVGRAENDLQAMDKRFVNIENVEYMAKNKYVRIQRNLNANTLIILDPYKYKSEFDEI